MSSIALYSTKQEQAIEERFVRLATQTDSFECYVNPHAARIARLADEVARVFNLARQDRMSLRLACLAHDIGEARMQRDYIRIRRTGQLSDEERMDITRHPVIGEQEAAKQGADRGAQLLVRWHHEWWNGDGYPDALRAEQIPLGARILRMCDAYCSLTDDRPFRNARTVAAARRHLTEWAGLEFDPRVVKAFLALRDLPELASYAIEERHPPVPAPVPVQPVAFEPMVSPGPSVQPAPFEPPQSVPVIDTAQAHWEPGAIPVAPFSADDLLSESELNDMDHND